MEADKAPWDFGAPILRREVDFPLKARRLKKFSKGNNEQLPFMIRAQNQYILPFMEV